MAATSLAIAQPFVKWPGGKRALSPDILACLPSTIAGVYREPFLGGGAIFFALVSAGRVKRAELSDVNADLVNAYQVVRNAVDDLIVQLRTHRNDESYFYAVRAQNQGSLSPIERAARLIYLNRTCFNGMYRVNPRGQFNVPFGRYPNPTICDEPRLRAASAVLQLAQISHLDFSAALQPAQPGDVVYADPPYVPLSATSNFTSYTAGGWGDADLLRLQTSVLQLGQHGVCDYVLSNSDTPRVRQVFAGFCIETVYARRAINSKGDKRGAVAEVLIRPPNAVPIRASNDEGEEMLSLFSDGGAA